MKTRPTTTLFFVLVSIVAGTLLAALWPFGERTYPSWPEMFSETTCPDEIYARPGDKNRYNFECGEILISNMMAKNSLPELQSELTYTFSEGGLFEVLLPLDRHVECPGFIVRMPWSNSQETPSGVSKKREIFDLLISQLGKAESAVTLNAMVPINSVLHTKFSSTNEDYPEQTLADMCLIYFLAEGATGKYIGE